MEQDLLLNEVFKATAYDQNEIEVELPMGRPDLYMSRDHDPLSTGARTQFLTEKEWIPKPDTRRNLFDTDQEYQEMEKQAYLFDMAPDFHTRDTRMARAHEEIKNAGQWHELTNLDKVNVRESTRPLNYHEMRDIYDTNQGFLKPETLQKYIKKLPIDTELSQLELSGTNLDPNNLVDKNDEQYFMSKGTHKPNMLEEIEMENRPENTDFFVQFTDPSLDAYTIKPDPRFVNRESLDMDDFPLQIGHRNANSIYKVYQNADITQFVEEMRDTNLHMKKNMQHDMKITEVD